MRRKPDVIDFLRHRPVLSLIIGAVLLVTGVVISDLPRMIASLGWPTTDGKIVSRQLMARRFKEYDGDLYTEIDVFVRYEYVVDGIPYASMSINAVDTNYYPYRVGIGYAVGKVVMVYYNPKDPAEAVLEPGFVGIFEAFEVYSYLVFGLGIYCICTGISSIKAKRHREQA